MAELGDTRIAKNGYHYTYTEDGYRLTHHIIAEEMLGRALRPSQERVCFSDLDRTNLDPSNIEVRPIRNGVEQRKEKLRNKIKVLQEELAALEAES